MWATHGTWSCTILYLYVQSQCYCGAVGRCCLGLTSSAGQLQVQLSTHFSVTAWLTPIFPLEASQHPVRFLSFQLTLGKGAQGMAGFPPGSYSFSTLQINLIPDPPNGLRAIWSGAAVKFAVSASNDLSPCARHSSCFTSEEEEVLETRLLNKIGSNSGLSSVQAV